MATSDPNQPRRAVVIGAGPAGLTVAYELLTRTNIQPVVLEQSELLGGLSRTINYKGNRIDIGGHRFFSKSDRVMQWWFNMLPVEGSESEERLTYQRQSTMLPRSGPGGDAEDSDRVMLIRSRRSRIYFMRKFFSYPITFSADTIRKLGLGKTILIGISYLRSVVFPIRDEKNLEQFFQNRFGRRLYQTFFKSYTEKVWGVDCKDISAAWGAQRIKGLSIYRTLTHVLKKLFRRTESELAQKDTETSLIEKFLYPKFGPGQMWEEVGCRVTSRGGHILTGWQVTGIEHQGQSVTAVNALHSETGERARFEGDYFFSTMPVKELISAMSPQAPPEVAAVASGLIYRDFITVGVLCSKTRLRDSSGSLATDNWIYIQEPDVLVGRIQIFNNWSPYLVADPEKIWIGLEYFCSEADALWRRTDAEMIDLAKTELQSLNLVDAAEVLDATVIRVPKTYPAYFGTYDRFSEVTQWTDRFDNLFLIGRNGMHRYNNQDHSMLTAMVAVDNIIAGVRDRRNLWELNTEPEYHEEKTTAAGA